MPLSEHEQRLLDQIERALVEDDPKFASTVRSTDLRTHMRRRMYRAGALGVVGLVVLVVGALAMNTWVGIAGFVVMIAALAWGLAAYKRLGSPASSHAAPDELAERRQRTPRGPASGGWRERVEERWKRRWDERDF